MVCRLTRVLLILGACLASGPAAAGDDMTAAQLVSALREGGYNLYFRHTETDWTRHDRIRNAGDWTSCAPARARQLSGAGRDTARAIGEAMRALDIPVRRVLASPYCRTVETARLMELGEVDTTGDIINMRVAEHFGGPDAVIQSARERLAAAPPEGANTVLVAHGNLAREATPVYPEEGECVVFRPEGGGFTFVGRLAPEQWMELAEGMKQ